MSDALILAILEEGKRKKQEIIDHAMEEAARIASDAVQRREASDRLAIEVFRRQSEDRTSRRLNATRQEAVRMVSLARERVIEATTFALRAKLDAVRKTPGYASILKALFSEAAGEITPGSTMRAEGLEVALLKTAAKSAGIDVTFSETPGLGGGFEVMSADGAITLLNTFESRTERAGEIIIREIGQRLRTLDVQSGLPDESTEGDAGIPPGHDGV